MSEIGGRAGRRVLEACAVAVAAFAILLLPVRGVSAEATVVAPARDAVDARRLVPLSLIMVEEEGCGFCLRWHAEVGPGYPLSSEGKRAPLVRRDRFAPDVQKYGRLVFTPTFILESEGVEKGRIIGYPGADFFWSQLTDMIDKIDARARATGTAARP
ncbi:MAG: hypothetical protein AB7E80_06035 [Hyphomicrobiaceae bacterium]